jgi:hypothetical protein
MKKSYLIVSSLAFASLTFGQTNKTFMNETYPKTLSVSTETVKEAPVVIEKAGGDVLFSETFTGSQGSWTTSGVEGTIWQYDVNGPNGEYSSTTQKITSPTANTGFMIFDSDLANTPGGSATWTGNLESPVIDLSAVPGALIKFYHSYRSCCASAFYPKVEVSTDDFATVTEFDVTTYGTGVNDNSGTNQVILNLSQFLATATNTNNFKFRFVWSGASHYFWQVDDIEVVEAHDYDVTLKTLWLDNILTAYEHTEIPVDFAGTLTVQGQVANYGHTIPANTQIIVSILDNAGNVVASETGGVLTQNFTSTKDTILFETGIDLSAIGGAGDYTVVGDLLIGETDADLDNDTLFRTLKITDFYLGQRNYEFNRSIESIGKLAGTSPNSTDMTFGNVMSIPASMSSVELQGLEVTLARSSTYPITVGQEIEIRLYEMDYSAGSFAESHIDLGVGRIFEIESSMLPSVNGYKDVLFNFNHASGATGPMELEGGKDYLIGVYCNGGSEHMAYGVNATDDDGSSRIYGPFGTGDAISWFTNGTQILTRMNFDPSMGIETIKNTAINEVSIYPNPTQNTTEVSYTLANNSTVEIQVVDITGKIIYNTELGTQNAGRNSVSIDASNYNNGIYYVTIVTGDSKVTKKFVKK